MRRMKEMQQSGGKCLAIPKYILLLLMLTILFARNFKLKSKERKKD